MINSELDITYKEITQRFSSEMQSKILYSVVLLRRAERLATSYDSENGYFLAFSGGKDSQCLYHIAKLAGVKFQAHMNLTSVDPPEVIRFVRQQYPDVEMIKPNVSIFNEAIKRKLLPTRKIRWCCSVFKEGAGAGKVTLIGVRHSESTQRSNRKEVEISGRKFSGTLEELDAFRVKRNKEKRGRKPSIGIYNIDKESVLGCIRGKESLLISPIINWTDDDVWGFLDTLNIRHCELYDRGCKRIGCLGCPESSPRQKITENKRYPHIKRNWLKVIDMIKRSGDGEDIYNKWINGGNFKKYLREPVSESFIKDDD